MVNIYIKFEKIKYSLKLEHLVDSSEKKLIESPPENNKSVKPYGK